MDLIELKKIIGDEKKYVEFVNTKVLLNRAHEFWIKLFHQNRDHYRNLHIALYKKDSYEQLTLSVTQGID